RIAPGAFGAAVRDVLERLPGEHAHVALALGPVFFIRRPNGLVRATLAVRLRDFSCALSVPPATQIIVQGARIRPRDEVVRVALTAHAHRVLRSEEARPEVAQIPSVVDDIRDGHSTFSEPVVESVPLRNNNIPRRTVSKIR